MSSTDPSRDPDAVTVRYGMDIVVYSLCGLLCVVGFGLCLWLAASAWPHLLGPRGATAPNVVVAALSLIGAITCLLLGNVCWAMGRLCATYARDVVSADSAGISHSRGGIRQTIRWNEIQELNVHPRVVRVGGPSGKEVFVVRGRRGREYARLCAIIERHVPRGARRTRMHGLGVLLARDPRKALCGLPDRYVGPR